MIQQNITVKSEFSLFWIDFYIFNLFLLQFNSTFTQWNFALGIMMEHSMIQHYLNQEFCFIQVQC